MQRSHSTNIIRIHIRTSSQVLFHSFDMSGCGSGVNRIIGIQLCTRLAAVFAEEVGDCGLVATDGPI